MKSVTIENVKARIADLEMIASHGELSLRGEFELACLRKLLALQERISELEENDREQMAELYRRNATIHRLQQQAAPVITDDRLLGNLETRIRSIEIGERKGALSTQQETSLKAYRLAVHCLRSSATSDENATDNTAQQFEALAISAGSGKQPDSELEKAKRCLPYHLDDRYKVNGSWIGSVQNYIVTLEQKLEENGIHIDGDDDE